MNFIQSKEADEKGNGIMITTEFLRLTILLQSIKMNFQLISYSLMLTCLL